MNIPQYPKNIGPTGWCPGCGHGIFVRLMQELLEEKGLIENNVCVDGVGCSANLYGCVSGGNRIECHHGRAPVCAHGVKLMLPNTFVYTYQGDGDAYSIGMGETMIAAHEDFPVSVFTINNGNYGMTGGQSALTTLEGQVTTTAVRGKQGKPFDIIPHMCDLNVAYVARGTTASLAEIRKLKTYMSKAIDVQMNEHRYAFVEVLTQCPTNWHMTLPEANRWVMEHVVKDYPLGEFKK